jgi:hypothetical protein
MAVTLRRLEGAPEDEALVQRVLERAPRYYELTRGGRPTGWLRWLPRWVPVNCNSWQRLRKMRSWLAIRWRWRTYTLNWCRVACRCAKPCSSATSRARQEASAWPNCCWSTTSPTSG